MGRVLGLHRQLINLGFKKGCGLRIYGYHKEHADEFSIKNHHIMPYKLKIACVIITKCRYSDIVFDMNSKGSKFDCHYQWYMTGILLVPHPHFILLHTYRHFL